jgi:hypothetical protein
MRAVAAWTMEGLRLSAEVEAVLEVPNVLI